MLRSEATSKISGLVATVAAVDMEKAALELLLHGAGQRVDITEGEVAIGAINTAENENV